MSAIKITTGCAGRFKLEAIKLDADGNEISRRTCADWFSNIITDQGLNYMGVDGDWLTAAQVGTGSTAPVAADTQLAAYLVGTTTTQARSSSAQSTAPYYASVFKTWRFAAGVAAGNLTEVGVGKTAATGSLYSRALILDGGGTPTTITVLSDEVLDVTYEHRTYPPTTDVTGTITISGSNYNYTIRAVWVTSSNTSTKGRWGCSDGSTEPGASSAMPADFTNSVQRAYNGSIAAITAQEPSGTISAASGVSTAAYSNNSLVRQGTQTFDLNSGNLAGGISAVKFSFNWCSYQIGFSPAIPKTSSMVLTLTYQHAWARATIP